jgi:periplasmic divalent cation tolerance protein
MTLIAVFTTVDQREQAQRIATTLVQRRLAACAQISEIDSIYSWQGEVREEAELRIVFKTPAAAYAALEAALRERHPYTLPQIVALPVEYAFAPYAQWVTEQVDSP